jgi:hypothetical protein
VSNYIGAFVTYWPCGKCVSGAVLDDGGIRNSFLKFVLEDIRAGRVVKWQREQMVSVRNCDCAPEKETAVATGECRCVRSDGETRFNINCTVHGKAP